MMILINKAIIRVLKNKIKKNDLFKMPIKSICSQIVKEFNNKFEMNTSKTPPKIKSKSYTDSENFHIFKNKKIESKFNLNNETKNLESISDSLNKTKNSIYKNEIQLSNTENFMKKLKKMDKFVKRYKRLDKLERKADKDLHNDNLPVKQTKPIKFSCNNYNYDLSINYYKSSIKKKIFQYLKENKDKYKKMREIILRKQKYKWKKIFKFLKKYKNNKINKRRNEWLSNIKYNKYYLNKIKKKYFLKLIIYKNIQNQKNKLNLISLFHYKGNLISKSFNLLKDYMIKKYDLQNKIEEFSLKLNYRRVQLFFEISRVNIPILKFKKDLNKRKIIMNNNINMKIGMRNLLIKVQEIKNYNIKICKIDDFYKFKLQKKIIKRFKIVLLNKFELLKVVNEHYKNNWSWKLIKSLESYKNYMKKYDYTKNIFLLNFFYKFFQISEDYYNLYEIEYPNHMFNIVNKERFIHSNYSLKQLYKYKCFNFIRKITILKKNFKNKRKIRLLKLYFFNFKKIVDDNIVKKYKINLIKYNKNKKLKCIIFNQFISHSKFKKKSKNLTIIIKNKKIKNLKNGFYKELKENLKIKRNYIKNHNIAKNHYKLFIFKKFKKLIKIFKKKNLNIKILKQRIMEKNMLLKHSIVNFLIKTIYEKKGILKVKKLCNFNTKALCLSGFKSYVRINRNNKAWINNSIKKFNLIKIKRVWLFFKQGINILLKNKMKNNIIYEKIKRSYLLKGLYNLKHFVDYSRKLREYDNKAINFINISSKKIYLNKLLRIKDNNGKIVIFLNKILPFVVKNSYNLIKNRENFLIDFRFKIKNFRETNLKNRYFLLFKKCVKYNIIIRFRLNKFKNKKLKNIKLGFLNELKKRRLIFKKNKHLFFKYIIIYRKMILCKIFKSFKRFIEINKITKYIEYKKYNFYKKAFYYKLKEMTSKNIFYQKNYNIIVNNKLNDFKKKLILNIKNCYIIKLNYTQIMKSSKINIISKFFKIMVIIYNSKQYKHINLKNISYNPSEIKWNTILSNYYRFTFKINLKLKNKIFKELKQNWINKKIFYRNYHIIQNKNESVVKIKYINLMKSISINKINLYTKIILFKNNFNILKANKLNNDVFLCFNRLKTYYKYKIKKKKLFNKAKIFYNLKLKNYIFILLFKNKEINFKINSINNSFNKFLNGFNNKKYFFNILIRNKLKFDKIISFENLFKFLLKKFNFRIMIINYNEFKQYKSNIDHKLNYFYNFKKKLNYKFVMNALIINKNKNLTFLNNFSIIRQKYMFDLVCNNFNKMKFLSLESENSLYYKSKYFYQAIKNYRLVQTFQKLIKFKNNKKLDREKRTNWLLILENYLNYNSLLISYNRIFSHIEKKDNFEFGFELIFDIFQKKLLKKGYFNLLFVFKEQKEKMILVNNHLNISNKKAINIYFNKFKKITNIEILRKKNIIEKINKKKKIKFFKLWKKYMENANIWKNEVDEFYKNKLKSKFRSFFGVVQQLVFKKNNFFELGLKMSKKIIVNYIELKNYYCKILFNYNRVFNKLLNIECITFKNDKLIFFIKLKINNDYIKRINKNADDYILNKNNILISNMLTVLHNYSYNKKINKKNIKIIQNLRNSNYLWIYFNSWKNYVYVDPNSNYNKLNKFNKTKILNIKSIFIKELMVILIDKKRDRLLLKLDKILKKSVLVWNLKFLYKKFNNSNILKKCIKAWHEAHKVNKKEDGYISELESMDLSKSNSSINKKKSTIIIDKLINYNK